MTAPDPGLTDLIAAHLRALIAEVSPSSYGDDDYDVGCDQGYINALNFLIGSKEFAVVVEQHTNGRTTELEAERDSMAANYVTAIGLRDMARDRAEKAEATIARVEALKSDLFLRGGNLIAQWGAARLIGAALEGEQQ